MINPRDPARAKHLSGVLLILLSAAVFSTAGLFVKGVQADSWSIQFWRALFAALFTTGYILFRGKFHYEVTAMGKSGFLAGLVGASGTVAFIPAFKLTSVANVSLIYAAAPFVAAVMMWIWIREKPTMNILIASVIAFAGVMLIVSGSLDSTSLKGDFLALWMTVAMSAYLCIYRRFPKTPAAGPTVVLSLVIMPIALTFGAPLTEPVHEITIIAVFGLVFSVASITLAEGARRLPASETALISALETPLAPLWAWWLLGEIPALMTLAGGAIILAAVYGSQLLRS